jgi:hypothetical protein
MKACVAASLLSVAQATTSPAADPVRPSDEARRVAQEIIREALLPPNGPEGRPLPLASHWNVGTVKGSYEPDHQIGLIERGHHVFPWMSWPSGDVDDARFEAYYVRLLRYFAELKLPVSMRGTQWNAMLVRGEYREAPESRWAGVVRPDGKRVPRLSPFGPVEPWRNPAKKYVDTPAMRRAQELYPEPPLVLWVSNNEPPELRWAKHGPLEEQSKRYLELYGEGGSNDFRRQVVGEGWIKRYRVMFDAMREALVNDTWKANLRFVGYGAFGPSHLGRWSGWKVHSLHCTRWTSPDWHVWDGGSPSYYTHNWNDNRDHWVFSTQVQAMNWVFMLKEAWRTNPGFWFEISTWDGNEIRSWMKGLGAKEPAELVANSSAGLAEDKRQLDGKLLKKSKTLQYLNDGQTYPPSRVAGWVQFGMWLLRPRVVREFRGHATPLAPVEPYWMETVRAVDRVHEVPTLTEFWRRGKLVANEAHEHPYQSVLPERYAKQKRWFLLDTDRDPPRPWKAKTNLPVFAMALVLGEESARRWLVYAHAPLEALTSVGVTLPEYGPVRIDVPREGEFYEVRERGRSVMKIEAP